jgi:hypothetical protein
MLFAAGCLLRSLLAVFVLFVLFVLFAALPPLHLPPLFA